jgi:DeoR family transcriptional regulator of aga operon
VDLERLEEPFPERTPGDEEAADELPDRSRRWRLILDLLAERGRLTVTDVASHFHVSEATVRRDFSELDRQQLATRTHGGIVASAVAYDLPARYRPSGRGDARERIAAAAADLVEPGSVVGFNGGTTTTATARRLATRPDLLRDQRDPAVTIVTNALNIATELVLRPHIRIVTLGGVARPQTYELIGSLAGLVLEELWLDTLMLGVDGISATGDVSCHDEGEAGINSLMVQRADRVVVVATGDKLGRRAFARICEAGAVTTLVTDESAPPDEVAALEELGLEVVKV